MQPNDVITLSEQIGYVSTAIFKEDYDKSIDLGMGAFGKVYLVRDKFGKKQEFAMKIINTDNEQEHENSKTEAYH